MRKNRGITLIALVVTVIVLVILSTISILLFFSNDGIISQSKKAKELAENDQIKTDIALNKIYDQIANGNISENLPDNTPDTEGGTPVKPNIDWGKAGAYTVSDKTGEILDTAPFSSKTVYAIADGKGNTIPVPYGFYYVGGTKDTGVVISDYPEDQNKYAGKEDVPSGIELNEDGSLHYLLKGNLFVWIPCVEEEYQKYIWSSYQSASPTPGIEIGELIQIQKYGGFYVGRYEAGLAETIPESTTTISTQAYNKEGIPQSKAGMIPWNCIDSLIAKKNAETMYQTASVQSGLMTGTLWDNMLVWMVEGKDSTLLTTNCNWGNFLNTEFSYTGRIAKQNRKSNGIWYSEPFSSTNQTALKEITTDGNGYLLTTGSSEQVKKKNLYDVAGNIWEWTEEDYSSQGSHRTRRGSCYANKFVSYPVCYRIYDSYTYSSTYIGFRVALYIK